MIKPRPEGHRRRAAAKLGQCLVPLGLVPLGLVPLGLVPLGLVLLAGLIAAPAGARTLSVGPSQPYPNPSAAAHAAEDGDTVLIEPAEYYDCAVWTRHRLVIAGAGSGVVITDTTCQGKALFVVTGDDTTIRDLTLARARVPDGNGAGVRLEGQGLSLTHVLFLNDEVGVLAGVAGQGTIRVSGCRFEDGGRGGPRPSFAVLAGAVGLLRIEDSVFARVKGGQISTAARRTELARNQIASGTGEAPAVAVLATGGDLLMDDNALSIGPYAPRLAAAVLAAGRGAPELRRNRLVNTTGQTITLLRDWTGMQPLLQDNQVAAEDEALSTSGLRRHRASEVYHQTKDAVRAFLGSMKRRLGL